MRLLPLNLHRPRPLPLPAHRLPPPPNGSDGDDLPAQGCRCGWFDSSHELAHGLHVTEHAGSDELCTLVPLGWWLQWELEAAQHGLAR